MKVAKLLLLTALLAAACSAAPQDDAAPAAFTDVASFEAALQSAGVAAARGESLSQPFLSVPGQVLTVNGQDVQVFAYSDEAVLESDAAGIAPDGGSTGTTMISWIADPHFYRAGNLMVIYVGEDAGTLALLESLLGAQFAGR